MIVKEFTGSKGTSLQAKSADYATDGHAAETSRPGRRA
jgi:hypothetical protein